MKKLIAALLVLSPLSALAAEVSGNVALVSDYRFRGISQNEGDLSPALQGGLDVSFANGIYLGTWASNVNFTGDDAANGGALELDLYGGWAGSVTDSLDIDVGYLYYAYPRDQSNDLDYWEIYAKGTMFGVTIGLAYADDYFAETGEFWYLSADYSYGFNVSGQDLSLDLHVGLNSFDDEEFLSGGEDSYVDYSLGLSTSQWDLDWSLAWVGNDLDDDDYFDLDDLIDDTIVLSVSKSL